MTANPLYCTWKLTLHYAVTLDQAVSGTRRPKIIWRVQRRQWCLITRLMPNDPYMGRTAPLTSKRYIVYIYSTNMGTEYFKHALYSPFFFSSKCSLFHNANLFGSCVIHVLYTECAKIKKKNSGAKGLLSSFLCVTANY